MNDADTTSATPPPRTRHETIAVFVLAAVAVLTAWCGFQSSKWGGEMSIAFSKASSMRIQAADADGEARDARALDLAIYAPWVTAVADGQPKLARYIEQRFTPEFAVAFDAWIADGRVEHGPFMRPEYVPDGTKESVRLTKQADQHFAAALTNNARGDRYSLLTVMFALVLFLTAMSERNLSRWASRTLLGLGIVVATTGFVIMLTFPIKI
jgi:hypothetical protein